MAWRHLGGARGRLTLGLLSGFFALWAASAGHAQTTDSDSAKPTPKPEAQNISAAEPSAKSNAISVLDATRDGSIEVDARGNGETQVKIGIRNTSNRQLRVVLPPGLVAAAATGQGLQSMGLGSVYSRPGAFGRSRQSNSGPAATDNKAGLNSLPANAPKDGDDVVVLDQGETVNLVVPSVCLNFGLPDPKPSNHLKLMSIDQYTEDSRVRAALKSLHAIDSSHGVAQAAMWNVANDLAFNRMAVEARRLVNPQEIAQAATFVQALGKGEMVTEGALTQDRLFVRVVGDKNLTGVAGRLAEELRGKKMLGLPAVVVLDKAPEVATSALLVTINLSQNAKDQDKAQAKAVVQYNRGGGIWQSLGQVNVKDMPAPTVLDGAQLAKLLDRQLAQQFVVAKSFRKSGETVNFKVENRLPFSVAKVVVSTDSSINGGDIDLDSLNVGPRREAKASVKGSKAKVERIVLNGL